MPGCTAGQASRVHHGITGIEAPEEPSNVMLVFGLKREESKEMLAWFRQEVHGNFASAYL